MGKIDVKGNLARQGDVLLLVAELGALDASSAGAFQAQLLLMNLVDSLLQVR